MLVSLPQIKQSWCAALVATLQTKINNRKKENASIPSLKDMKTSTVKISVCDFSESNQAKLDNLCSRIKTSSAPSNFLLTAKLELIANSKEDQTDVAKCNELKIERGECNLMSDMEVDNFAQSEVIEISDDSPEASPSGLIEIANPPALSTHKTMGVTVHSPVMSHTRAVSEECCSQSDDSTLQKTNEIPGKTALLLSEIPNPPDLEIQNMEVELPEDAFLNEYNLLKNHLRSEDLDAELIQEFLNGFPEIALKDLVTVFTFLEMGSIPETSTIMLIRQFLLSEKDCSFQATVTFAYYCIGVWLGGLQSAPSRNLLAAVTAFAQKHPKAFVDGIMVKQFNATSLLWPKCDLIVKIIKNFEKENLQYFMEKLVTLNEDSFSVWNEHMILVLSTVLERRLELDGSSFEKFANWLKFQSLPLASNLKFAKLVLTIISKYGFLVQSWLPTFKQILNENNTFLKKSCLTALKKLED